MEPAPGAHSQVPSVRPRYPRIAAASSSALITAVAVLGGVGVIPGSATARPVSEGGGDPGSATGALALSRGSATGSGPAASSAATSAAASPGRPGAGSSSPTADPPVRGPASVPSGSGHGKRVVFDISDQRVWLVSAADRVRRTYLVSGSLTDNLSPGSYAVYSRSRAAVGVDDSGTMRFMVRFTSGGSAAIGFHDIPELNGRPLQSRAELGTPQSHGCIRQWRPDAKALWDFAPIGTRVVVTA